MTTTSLGQHGPKMETIPCPECKGLGGHRNYGNPEGYLDSARPMIKCPACDGSRLEAIVIGGVRYHPPVTLYYAPCDRCRTVDFQRDIPKDAQRWPADCPTCRRPGSNGLAWVKGQRVAGHG